MPATQQSSIYFKLASVLTAALDLTQASSVLAYDKMFQLDAGTGANQANQVWSDTRTLTTGANETLDINGVLLNAAGESVTFTKVKLIIIVNKGTTDLTVGGAATNGFVSPFGTATDTVKVRAGGFIILYAPDATGYAATAATADQLKIANAAGASCDYDIVLAGVN